MRRYIIFFICTIASICSISAANYVCTDMFNLNNGLPNNGVTSLLQDSKGYIWIGTYDGLTRYNGHSCVTFTNTINSKIFQSNRIRSLFEGNDLEIWIGTDFGVTRYNYRTGQFFKLESGVDGVQNQECIIREIMHSQDGSQIYCLTERSGVLVYAENGELLKNFTIDREAIFQDAQHIDKEKYLLASNEGVILYDFETAEVTNIYNSNGAANFVGTLTRLDANTILYGSNNGILKITYDVANYQFKVDENYTYTVSGVKTLHIDAQGDMWVGSISQGLFYLEDVAKNWGKRLKRLSEPMRPAAFLSPYLGAMLVATFDNGLLKYNQDHQHFKSLDLSNIDIKPIRTVQILPYDDNHILYQNSYQHLSFYDLRDGKERALPFNLSASQMNNLRYITKLTNGEVWLFMSNDKQSWRLIKSKDSESLIRVDDQIMNDFEYEFPYTIREDYYGYMWIGTQEGLYRLTLGEDRQIDKITSIEEHSISRSKKIEKINTIYPDTISQSIWIGTSSQGLYNIKYDSTEQIKSASITNYKVDPSGENRIPSNFVSYVTRCKDTLWVATEQGGLCRVEEDNVGLRFIAYGTSDGVSSNSIKSILMDENGDIWVSTAFGLSKYNISKDDFLTYRAQQGVPFDEFTYDAIYAGDKLVFASENNLCYFNPTQLPQTSPTPNIEFTNLKLSGRVVEPIKKFNGRVILEHSLIDNDIIRLKYKENMITIGVDAICQDNSYGNHIKYRLLPLSSSWITAADNSQEIVLSGLRHGNYTLEVKTSDFFGQRSNLKCLNIDIKPPFWLSIWAYIIYALLIIAISAVVLYVITNMQRLRYRLHIEKINKLNAEKLNSEKLRYFSNISHEIKTPLTLIVAPISLLLERFTVDVDVRGKLDTIKRQSEKIIRLVDLVQGVQLSDSTLLERKDSSFCFNDYIANIISDFKLMAAYDSKDFIIETPKESITIEADSEMLEKIINNLISNAFKYTRTKEQVKISYGVSRDSNLWITVEDNGYGISPSDLDHVFERFFRARQRGSANVGGTGIGLYFTKTLVELHNGIITAESELGEGTKFTVELPIVKEVREIAATTDNIEENYKEQILGELTIEKISSESEFKDSLVYIVEDNSEMRQFISSIISKFFCVKTFSNGAECYEAMTTQWPDIVVSDVMMPIMDGYELCETLKSDIKTSHIPIILLTACSTVDDKIKGLKYGADAYIPKPFYPNHIITRIETLLKGRKQLRERFQINIPIVYGETSTMRAKDNDFLDKLYQIFSDNLDNDELDIDQIVHSFGINRNLLYQKVKAITNATPRELLQIYRIKRAAEYLQDGDRNVSEVCDLTGFKSRTHFSRLFKETYGVTPSQYGKKINS